MVFVYLCLVILECLQCWLLLEFYKLVQKSKEPEAKHPPKARGSFVVKRMEERIKEALYE